MKIHTYKRHAAHTHTHTHTTQHINTSKKMTKSNPGSIMCVFSINATVGYNMSFW